MRGTSTRTRREGGGWGGAGSAGEMLRSASPQRELSQRDTLQTAGIIHQAQTDTGHGTPGPSARKYGSLEPNRLGSSCMSQGRQGQCCCTVVVHNSTSSMTSRVTMKIHPSWAQSSRVSCCGHPAPDVDKTKKGEETSDPEEDEDEDSIVPSRPTTPSSSKGKKKKNKPRAPLSASVLEALAAQRATHPGQIGYLTWDGDGGSREGMHDRVGFSRIR